jgi:hypothetical protein
MRNGEQRATLFGAFHPQAIDFGGTMSVERLLIAALLAVMMLAASAFAQKNELTGIIGRTFVSDQGVKGVSLAKQQPALRKRTDVRGELRAFFDGQYVRPSDLRGAGGGLGSGPAV